MIFYIGAFMMLAGMALAVGFASRGRTDVGQGCVVAMLFGGGAWTVVIGLILAVLQ